jgi:hypothetical protein
MTWKFTFFVQSYRQHYATDRQRCIRTIGKPVTSVKGENL